MWFPTEKRKKEKEKKHTKEKNEQQQQQTNYVINKRLFHVIFEDLMPWPLWNILVFPLQQTECKHRDCKSGIMPFQHWTVILFTAPYMLEEL